MKGKSEICTLQSWLHYPKYKIGEEKHAQSRRKKHLGTLNYKQYTVDGKWYSRQGGECRRIGTNDDQRILWPRDVIKWKII